MDRTAKNWIRRFVESETGGVETISFAIWLPFVMGLFLLVTDVSYILFQRANVLRIMEDANRMRSLGIIESDAQTVQLIEGALTFEDGSRMGTANSVILQGVVRSRMEIPISNMDLFGLISVVSGNATMTVFASHFKEDPEA